MDCEYQRIESTEQRRGRFPPAMQWRDAHTFWRKNWRCGFGLPLGLLAIAGFIWSGWRMLTDRDRENGQWRIHALLWVGQLSTSSAISLQTPSMRYFLPVYPFLAIFAAWGWCFVRLVEPHIFPIRNPTPQSTRLRSGLVRIPGLAGYFRLRGCFTGIYTRPITRIAASR